MCVYCWFSVDIHVSCLFVCTQPLFNIYIIWILLIFSWISMFVSLYVQCHLFNIYCMNIIDFQLNINVSCLFVYIKPSIQYILYEYCWFSVEYSCFLLTLNAFPLASQFTINGMKKIFCFSEKKYIYIFQKYV